MWFYVMIHVSSVENILSKTGRKLEEKPFRAGARAWEMAPPGFEFDARAIHNGRLLDPIENPELSDDDNLTFIRLPQGIEWGVVLLTALISSVIGAGLSFLIGLLIPAPETPKGYNDSPTYSWNGIQTQALNGIPIPRVYGTHLLGGNVIQAFTRAENLEESKLYLVVALGSGTLHSIAGYESDQDNLPASAFDAGMLQINGRNISDFEGVSVSIRRGTWDQAAISGLGALNVESDTTLSGTKILCVTQAARERDVWNYSAWIEILNSTHECDYAEINLVFPQGFYYASDDGPKNIKQTFVVEYREHGDTNWISAGVHTLTTKQLGQPVLTLNTQTMRTEANNPAGLFPSTGYWEMRIRKYATGRPAPDYPEDRKQIAGGQILSVNWYRDEQIAYRGTALLSIEALGTEQLSGSMPQVRVMVEGVEVPAYTGAAWVDRFSNNAAWLIADMCTDPLNGLGAYFSTAADGLYQLDTDSLEELAAHVSAEQLPFNGVFDTLGISVWDAIQRVCTVGRAKPIYNGNLLKFKPEKSRAAVQAFTMANIVRDSFSTIYLDQSQRPNLIEVQFLNAALNYERDTVQLVDSEKPASDPPRKKTYDLPGITNADQALRMAQFFLNINRLITKRHQWTAGLDAVVCEAGDRVYLNHDLPGWEYSGRLVSGGALNHVHADRAVSTKKTVGMLSETLADLAAVAISDIGYGDWRILVQHTNGDLETLKTIDDFPADYAAGEAIPIHGTFAAIPASNSKYIIGTVDRVSRSAIISKVTLKADLTREIEALDYHEEMFTINPAAWDGNTFTTAGAAVSIDQFQHGLLAAPETVGAIPTGADGTEMELTWSTAAGPSSPALYMIFYRLSGGVAWEYAGATPGNSYRVSGLEASRNYEFSVVPVDAAGHRSAVNNGARFTASTASGPASGTGRIAPPSGFVLSRLGDLVKASWTPAAGVFGYELRRGGCWQTGETVYRGPASTIETRDWRPTVSGAPETWFCRAYDASGYYSRAVTDQGNFVVPHFEWNYLSQAEGPAWSGGTLSGLVVNGDGHLELDGGTSGTYTTAVLELDTAQLACLYLLASVNQTCNLTVGRMTWTLGSEYARTAALNGPLDGSAPVLVGEATDTLADLAAVALGAYTVTGAALTLEVRRSADGITWGAWETYAATWATIKAIQARITLTGESGFITPVVEDCQMVLSTRNIF